MELVKIDAQEFGIEESKANQIKKVFQPMLDKMESLEGDFNAVVKMDITPESAAIAKELRLKYVKIRTGTAEIHRTQKAFYLAGGRFIDGWKNAQLFASQGNEEKLKAIEDHEKNKEIARLTELRESRISQLVKFGRENDPVQVELMDDDVWSNYLVGVKSAHEIAIAAEKKAEDDRIAKEQADKLEREKVAKENADLKAAAEAREKADKIESDRRAKVEAERAANQAKEQAIQDEAIRKEREEKEAAEAKLKAQDEAIAKAKQDEDERLEKELNAGDAEKVKMLTRDLEALKTKYSFKSKANKKTYTEVGGLIDKIVGHITK